MEVLNLSCLCGQVGIATEKRPDFIHECNCSMCSKTGARWGYFHPSEVRVDGATVSYSRADKDEPNTEVQFCATCGSTTHFVLTESAVSRFGNTVVGVNMWLANPEDLAGIELRYPNGRAWAGVGDFSFIREARVLP